MTKGTWRINTPLHLTTNTPFLNVHHMQLLFLSLPFIFTPFPVSLAC